MLEGLRSRLVNPSRADESGELSFRWQHSSCISEEGASKFSLECVVGESTLFSRSSCMTQASASSNEDTSGKRVHRYKYSDRILRGWSLKKLVAKRPGRLAAAGTTTRGARQNGSLRMKPRGSSQHLPLLVYPCSEIFRTGGAPTQPCHEFAVRPPRKCQIMLLQAALGIRTSTHKFRDSKEGEVTMRCISKLLIFHNIFLFALTSSSIHTGRY